MRPGNARATAACAFAWALLAAPTSAQTPGPRNQPGGAFLPESGAVVVFGGQASSGDHLAETWICSARGWRLVDASGPTPRSSPLVSISESRALLFGGYDGDRLSDTWLFTGDSWTQVGGSGPPARSAHAMAYDPRRGVVVLFGGAGSTGLLGDTWEFDATGWSRIDASGPAARRNHAMGFDPESGRVVLFGGSDGVRRLGDTWLWNGVAWEEAPAPGGVLGPHPRDHHSMASGGDGLFLFGGWSGEYLGDLWRWVGGTWALVDDGGVGRAGRPAFVAHQERLLLFGGGGEGGFVGDLVRYDGRAWARVTGC